MLNEHRRDSASRQRKHKTDSVETGDLESIWDGLDEKRGSILARKEWEVCVHNIETSQSRGDMKKMLRTDHSVGKALRDLRTYAHTISNGPDDRCGSGEGGNGTAMRHEKTAS